MSADTNAAIRNPYVRRIALARGASALGQQIINVTIGWELYDRTGSAWSLGLVGLFELAPVILFTIPSGNLADRFPRRNIAIAAQGLLGLAALGQMTISLAGGPVWMIYSLLLMVGTARIFSSTSTSTILPQLVPRAQFAHANAWVSSAGQFAAIAGPAVGGSIIAWTGTATWSFFAATAGYAVFIVCFAGLPVIRPAADARKRSAADLFAGFGFIRRTPVFLAAITLDMFAVLLGGATVLLPIFAKDILHVGPDGLGWLRAAPSCGSLLMALTLTRLRPWSRPGVALLTAVTGFGLATIGFGLSRSFPLSLACLMLTGMFDSVSVVIRSTLEQSVTPDHLRGRVSAFSYVFIGFSNEFGAFESGSTAALLGPVMSVAGGGIGTLCVVAAVAVIWPALTCVGPLHSLKPAETEVAEESQVRHSV